VHLINKKKEGLFDFNGDKILNKFLSYLFSSNKQTMEEKIKLNLNLNFRA